MTAKRDVLGLGCATIDELLFVDAYPKAETKVQVRRLEVQGGGLTATALVAASRLGASCAYAGQLGYDETSRRVVQILREEGIETSLVPYRDDAAAIRSLIVVDTTNHTRNIFFHRPGKVGAAIDAPAESEIAASRVLLVDHYGGAGIVRACEIARRYGVPIVADFERTDVDNWDEFFPLVSHLILSRGFAERLSGESDPEKMVAALYNENRATVIVTCGEEGCVALEAGKLHRFPAFEAEVVDTTGCGDCFHGVYAATLAWDWPLPQRVLWASAAAALKVAVAGAQKGLPTRAEVEAFLAHSSLSAFQL